MEPRNWKQVIAENISEELNLLKLRECARIGFVDVPEIAEAFRRMIRETGDCIVVSRVY